MLRPALEIGELTESGDRNRGMPRYMEHLSHPPGQKRPPLPIRKLVAMLQRTRGPKGLELARAVIEMKLLRNLNYVRSKFPKFESRVVPDHVYETLEPYAELYEQTLGRPLAPTAAESSSEGYAGRTARGGCRCGRLQHPSSKGEKTRRFRLLVLALLP